jgi:hypothetical protein
MIWKGPTVITEESRMSTGRFGSIRTPSTKVPFREPVSTYCRRPLPNRKAPWIRETLPASRRRPLLSRRPIVPVASAGPEKPGRRGPSDGTAVSKHRRGQAGAERLCLVTRAATRR